MDMDVLFTPQGEKAHPKMRLQASEDWSPAHLTTTFRKESHDDMVDIAD
jgi:hypothetical protein